MISTRPELRRPSPAEATANDDRAARDRVAVNCVQFSRVPALPDGALRNFEADVELARSGDAGGMSIGRVSGRLGWLSWLPELAETAAADDDTAVNVGLAIAVGNDLSPQLDSTIDGVLIIERLWLDPAWRGAGLARLVADELMDLLLLTPDTTLVLATLDRVGPPTRGKSGPTLPAQELLQEYREAGLEQWLDGSAWYMRPTCGEITLPAAG